MTGAFFGNFHQGMDSTPGTRRPIRRFRRHALRDRDECGQGEGIRAGRSGSSIWPDTRDPVKCGSPDRRSRVSRLFSCRPGDRCGILRPVVQKHGANGAIPGRIRLELCLPELRTGIRSVRPGISFACRCFFVRHKKALAKGTKRGKDSITFPGERGIHDLGISSVSGRQRIQAPENVDRIGKLIVLHAQFGGRAGFLPVGFDLLYLVFT